MRPGDGAGRRPPGHELGACSETVVFSDDAAWVDPKEYPAVGEGKILVTNSGDDTLSWLDLETLEPVFEEPIGRLPPEREGPHHGVAAKDGKSFFIGISNVVPGGGSGPHGSHGTGTAQGYLLKYDVATHRARGRDARRPQPRRRAPHPRRQATSCRATSTSSASPRSSSQAGRPSR